MTFKKPDFSKGPMSKHLDVIWDAWRIEFNKLEKKMAHMDGKLSIILLILGALFAMMFMSIAR